MLENKQKGLSSNSKFHKNSEIDLQLTKLVMQKI